MLTRLVSAALRLALSTWRGSLVGRAAGRVCGALGRAWAESRIRDAAGRPVVQVPSGRVGELAERAAQVTSAFAALLRTGYLRAAPASRAARWWRAVAAHVSAYPVAAAGFVLLGLPAGYAATERLLLRLFPWARWVDFGSPALGPAGLGRSVPATGLAAAFAGGVALSAVGRFRRPSRATTRAIADDSRFLREAAELLHVEGDENRAGGEAPRPPGRERRPGGAGTAPGPAAERALGTGAAVTTAVFGAVAGALLYMFPVVAWLKVAAALTGLALLLFSTEWYIFAVAAAAPFLESELLVVAAAGAFASCLLRAIAEPRRIGPAGNPGGGAMIFFAVVLVFATATSVTWRGSLPDLAANGAAMLFVLSMIAVSRRPGVPLRFAAGAAVGVALQGLVGMYQYAAGIPVQSAWVDAAQAAFLRVRVLGSFGNPNVFAEYLVLLLPLVAALFFAARRLPHKVLWLGAGGAGGLALLLTFSRGGWVGLAVAALVFAVFYDRRLAAVLLIGALLVVSVPAGQNLVLPRLRSIVSPNDSSSIYRMAVWRETADMIADFWPSGVGLGHRAYMTAYPQYMHDRTKRPFHAHNSYLQLLAETGVLGLLAFAWLVWRLFRSSLACLRAVARRPVGDPYARPLRALLAGGLAALAGALVHGLVEPLLYIPRVTFTFWFLAGIVLCLAKVCPATAPDGAVAPAVPGPTSAPAPASVTGAGR